MQCIYFDTKTSDLKPGQICQLSYIIDDNSKYIASGNYFFKVEKMTDAVYKLTGITVDSIEKLSNGKCFADYAEEIHELFSDKCLVGHNVEFDKNFLSIEMWRAGKLFVPVKTICTMNYFKNIINVKDKMGSIKNPKLSDLVDKYNIDTDKVLKYAQKLFNIEGDNLCYHDSRYDTAAMYIAINIHREITAGKLNGLWKRTFELK